MAFRVNPPPHLRLPEEFAKDKAKREFFRQIDQILFQLWNRTGGPTDAVDEAGQTLTSTGSRVSRNAAKINSLELKDFEIVQTSIDFTTIRNQIIICKNSSRIEVTLDPQAIEEDEVHIKRRDAEIKVIGTVDGFTNRTINIKGYSMHLVFDGVDWSEI